MLPDRFVAGMRLSAAAMELIRAEHRRLAKWSAAAPLSISQDESGFRVSIALPEVFPVRITGKTSPASNAYSWSEVSATAGGGWATTVNGRTGTTTVDPIYEDNGSTTVPVGSIVLRATRDRQTGELRFERGC